MLSLAFTPRKHLAWLQEHATARGLPFEHRNRQRPIDPRPERHSAGRNRELEPSSEVLAELAHTMVATRFIDPPHAPEVALQFAVLHELGESPLAQAIALPVDVEAERDHGLAHRGRRNEVAGAKARSEHFR